MVEEIEKRKEFTRRVRDLAIKLSKDIPPLKITKKTFSQRDLIGKTIREYVEIGNPRPVFTSRESPNPAQFQVQLYDDWTFLLANSWGNGECKNTDFYYDNGKELFYSDNLFG